MKKKLLVVIAVVLAVALVVITAVTMNNDGDENILYTADVWLDDGDTEIEYSGTGYTLREIISDALQDHDVTFASNGNVSSVDDIINGESNTWVIFKWASPGGWSTFTGKASQYIDGMTIALRYADKIIDTEGNITYSAPDIEVEYKVYFFLQFKEQYNSTNWMQNLNLTDSAKQAGVWIEGTGRNNNEALADAITTYLLTDSEYYFDTDGATMTLITDGEEGLFTYGLRVDMYGWFLSFFGWSDVKVNSEGGEYGTWTYWAQYAYHPNAVSLNDPDQWVYNQMSFGMYDITNYRYFALVLQTTASEDDIYTQLPAPSEIPTGL